MWTPEALLSRQAQRRADVPLSPPQHTTGTTAVTNAVTNAIVNNATNAPPSTPPLRADQIRRLNVYLSTAVTSTTAASAAAAAAVGVELAEPPAAHVDLPEDVDVLTLCRRSDLSLALLEAVGCHMPQLLAARVPLTALRAWGCDGVHLSARPVVAAQLVSHFGASCVAASALSTAADALALAGSTAATQLGLTPRLLLKTVAKPAMPASTTAASPLPFCPAMTPSVSDMALCVLDLETTRMAMLLGERQRQTGRPVVVAPSVALFQCLTVSDLAGCGIEASELVRRYHVDVQTLAQALGATSLRQLAPLGVVVV